MDQAKLVCTDLVDTIGGVVVQLEQSPLSVEDKVTYLNIEVPAEFAAHFTVGHTYSIGFNEETQRVFIGKGVADDGSAEVG